MAEKSYSFVRRSRWENSIGEVITPLDYERMVHWPEHDGKPVKEIVVKDKASGKPTEIIVGKDSEEIEEEPLQGTNESSYG